MCGESKRKWSERSYLAEKINCVCYVTNYRLILSQIHLSALEKALIM